MKPHWRTFRRGNVRSAFTLIEVMVAMLLLALLASAAALSFSRPLQAARMQDGAALLKSADSAARQAAVATGRNTRLAFDLTADTVSRLDGNELSTLRTKSSVPPGLHLKEVRIGLRTVSAGEAVVDLSPLGASRTYALRLVGPSADQWLLFAGLTGEFSQIPDESSLDIIFSQTQSRHDAD